MFKLPVWEICKFWILQNKKKRRIDWYSFERYVNFEFYKTVQVSDRTGGLFERYVNFEFYKTSRFAVYF